MKKLFHLLSFLFQNIKLKMRLLAVLTLSGMPQMPSVFSHYSNKVSQPLEERVKGFLFLSPASSSQSSQKTNLSM